MSRFTDHLCAIAASGDRGMVTGIPSTPTRRSWSDIHTKSRRIAGGLAGHGIGRGATVAVLAGQPGAIAPVAQAIWLRGAAITMLQQPTPRTDLTRWLGETRRVLEMIDADLIIVGDPFIGRLTGDTTMPVVAIDDLVHGPDLLPVDPDEDDPALLQLSSGSTGDPKAVVITHRNLYANITAFLDRSGLQREPDQVAVSWLPLFHDMGMIAFLALPMMTGMELVSVTPGDFLADPLLWADLITRYRGTFTAAPNFAYAFLGDQLRRVADDDAYDLSSMRYAVNGAEPIDCVAMAQFHDATGRFGWSPTALTPGYGMAEAVLTVAAPEPGVGLRTDRIDSRILESERRAQPVDDGREYANLGPALPGLDVRVVNPDDGTVLEPRRIGEFELRGEYVTATVITSDGPIAAQDDDGWLRTGDIGYLTEHGELIICGRRKDVIIVSGRNLYPTDIEHAAERVTGVRKGNTAAVALEAGTAAEHFAVIAESAHHDEQAVQLRRAISVEIFETFGVAPRRVRIVPPGSLPKTSSGKLRRADARALVARSTGI
ncbi:fatty acyl-AMP ligase [Nocardia sp. NPDC051030]|uniref:fatty acyl-AMP ligase n=1 Tax=Nocardia sp. NPDC051030 TaxID=3155162 RepID=UPI00342A9C29